MVIKKTDKTFVFDKSRKESYMTSELIQYFSFEETLHFHYFRDDHLAQDDIDEYKLDISWMTSDLMSY
jgi:hypothetical protein